jgi:hypothetical protein
MNAETQTVSQKWLLVSSLILSFVTAAAVIWTNLQIAQRYKTADGKDRALFGITVVLYSYKLFFAAGALFAILLAISAAERGARKSSVVFAFAFSLVSLTMVFLRLWKLMV